MTLLRDPRPTLTLSSSRCSVVRASLLALVVTALTALVVTGTAGAAEWTVGTGQQCDFEFLDKAISAAADGDTLRLQAGSYRESDDGVFNTSGYTIKNKSLIVIGGHAYCGGPRVSHSILEGTTSPQRIVTLRAFGTRRSVRLEHLTITGGAIASPYTEPYAGGILIEGLLDVALDQVQVIHNDGIEGGGITMLGDAALVLVDSRLGGNEALENGGGLFCRGGLVAFDGATIDSNQAAASGGGAYLDDCSVYGGEGDVDISSNTAQRDGGGLALTGATGVLAQVATVAAQGAAGIFTFTRNTAVKRGGGAFLEQQSWLYGTHMRFVNNLAGQAGGAISATSKSALSLTDSGSPCDDGEPCRLFTDNFTFQAGGAVYLFDSTATLESVRGHGNGAPLGGGAFAYADVDSSLTVWSNALDRHVGDTLIHANDAKTLDVRSSTVFDNPLHDFVVYAASVDDASVSQSIFDGNGVPYVFTNGLDFTCNLVDGAFPLPANEQQTAVGDPRFVAAGDWHLRADSPALNLCGGDTPHADTDLDADERPGPSYDAGADERD